MLGEAVLAGPNEIAVTTNAAPEGVVAQVHATLFSDRTPKTPDGMLHLDPTHSCGNPAHLVIMASRGLAASEFRTQVGMEACFRADPVPHARCATEEHGLSSSS